MKKMRHVINDADTGVDDSLAILYALRSPNFKVEGITTCYGNSNAFQSAENSIRLIKLSKCGYEVPVVVGANESIDGGFESAPAYIHGDNGIGNVELPESDQKVLNESAVDFILRKAEELDGELEIITTGRMTNLAMAVMKDTKLPKKVKRVVTMGGTLYAKGNVNPYAEANIQGDAHASDIVFRAGFHLTLVVSVIFAYFHLVLKANNVLCGTAVNTVATGLTVFVLQIVTGEKGNSSSLQSFVFPNIDIPVIKNIPIIGEIVSGHNALTYIALIMVFVVWFLMYKTPLGLRMRAIGESPDVASSVGQSVSKIQFLAIILCGILTSLGGMYLSMGYLDMFVRDMTAGRGFIALAACSMGRATPIGALVSAMIFAFFDGLSNILQILKIPSEFIQMLPYLSTIIGLTIYSIQKRARLKKNEGNA